MRLRTSRRFTNRMQGEHMHGKGGQSTEFADFRDYTEGDDIRYVDWNIFARLGRPYLKLYKHEEEQAVAVLIDASASMGFEGKLRQAQRLAGAFAVMSLFGAERLALYGFNERGARIVSLPQMRGRGSLRRAFGFIESLEAGGSMVLEEGVEAMLRHHRGRGVAILISDFLSPNDLAPSFNRLFSAGLEVCAVQVLGPTELDPELTEDARLLDSESRHTLDVTVASDVLTLYQGYLERFRRHLEALCRQRGGKFMCLSSAEPIEAVVTERLRRRGWAG